ncbi:hypothetical protein D5366_01070 [Neokomagataea tanensis]|uniref:NADH:ubiquinone oxidoreductase-like 20kDa subunit domain-containing protein n=1 Tax=Neokomagataea tanensis TaxID=661191 RepID=A0A4Y6V692_9PROT|nr:MULTISPECIES: hypothetical protein [Neokomagataea]QDH24086.1 hypothetical protein D5366_01070 [Neokomagataea tanensis]
MKSRALGIIEAFLDAHRWRAHAPVGAAGALPVNVYFLETGSCEGCAMELEALCGGGYALEQAGFRRVHRAEDADWLLVTGTISRRCAERLDQVWRAMPAGRCLIAIGRCAIDGGPFGKSYATLGGLSGLTRVQRAVHGCPPEPRAILAALIGFRDGITS